MKKYFATGVIVLLPLALTFWIVSFIIGLLTNPFVGIAEAILSALGLNQVSFLFLSSHQVLEYSSVLLVLLFLMGVIIGIGAIGRHFFFKYLMKLGDKILHSIPVISTVYKTTQELIQTILTTSNKSFKQVVLVPFPTAESWSIGLVTRDDMDLDNRVAVFVPTTPNPTSGFLIMFHRDKIVPLDMKVEEALRYVISCGVLLTPIRRSDADNDSSEYRGCHTIMKKCFITGLVILLPLVITYLIINFIITLITKPFEAFVHLILERYHLFEPGLGTFTHDQITSIIVKLMIIVALFVIILVIGIIGRWFIFHSLFHFMDRILHKIPVVNKVYISCKDFTQALFSPRSDSFSQVVLVPFPSADHLSIGLITSEIKEQLLLGSNDKMVSVLIPGTPNPTIGFLLLFSRKNITLIDMRVDQAIKYIMSCGSIMPSHLLKPKKE